jgi:hypothetical protein
MSRRRDPEKDVRRSIFEDAEEVSAEHAPDPNGLDDLDARTPPQSNADLGTFQRKHRFKLLGFNDIKLSATASYLVHKIIPMQGLIVVWGPPKCGKSFWTLDLLFHIALEWEYRGHRVKQGRVVYIGCEGEFAIPARVEAFRQSKLAENTEEPPFHLLLTRLGLASDVDELIFDLKAQLGAQRPTVIAIDTLNRSLEGSESSDEDMGNYVKAVDKLRAEFHCAVIIIHHCGIDGTRPRGHTALRGASDAEIAIKKDNSGRVITTVEFMKDGPEGEQTTSRLKPVEIGFDDDHEIITSCIIEDASGDATPAPKMTPIKLPPGAQIALDTLERALAAHGELAPTHNHIPATVRVVKAALWQVFYIKSTSAGERNIEHIKRDWRRHRDGLLSKKIIGTYDEMVWKTDTPGQA